MSRLNELIAVLCPDGVKYTTIGEACVVYTGGEAPQDYIKVNKPIGEYLYPIYSNGINEKSIYGFSKDYRIKEDAITFSSIGTIGFPTIRKGKFTPIIRLKVIVPKSDLNLTLGYLKYALEIANFLKNKSSVPNINANMIKNIKIPLPPLPVQQEIVRILDQYTAAQEELEAKLRAELDTRTQQYEYYRELALSGTKSVWEYERIGDICSQTDNIAWNEVRDSTFKYIDLSSVDRETHSIGATKIINSNSAPSRAQQVVITDDVIFGTTRPTLKRFCLIPDEYHEQICSTGFCVLRADKVKVLPKFLFHQISKREFYSYLERVQRGVAYPSVSDTDVKEFKIPIPPLAEQERIVSILDRLGRQINDLKQALQLELEARRKQYEYYRDQLLTFKELQA